MRGLRVADDGSTPRTTNRHRSPDIHHWSASPWHVRTSSAPCPRARRAAQGRGCLGSRPLGSPCTQPGPFSWPSGATLRDPDSSTRGRSVRSTLEAAHGFYRPRVAPPGRGSASQPAPPSPKIGGAGLRILLAGRRSPRGQATSNATRACPSPRPLAASYHGVRVRGDRPFVHRCPAVRLILERATGTG